LGTLREDSKRLYLLSHVKKTDEELSAIIRSNLSAISYCNQAEAMRLFGEIDACNQILDKRMKAEEAVFEEDEKIERAAFNWKHFQEEKRANSIYKLPVATSYPGQLVASVLEEEEGLSADEIRSWAEELAQLSEQEYGKLLADLVSEGILSEENKKYYLLTPCTADLYPVNPLEWAKKIAKNSDVTIKSVSFNELTDKQLRFLALLISRNQPATEYDWYEFTSPSLSSQYFKDRASDRVRGMKEKGTVILDVELSALLKMGILTRQPISGSKSHLYYFRMLGEELSV